MQIDGKFVVNGKIQEVWAMVLEPGTLASCIPGAEKIESTDNKTYNCLVKQSVGPISVKLQFVVVLTEITPPTYVKAVGRGEALGKLGTFGIDLTVHLVEQQNKAVEIIGQMSAWSANSRLSVKELCVPRSRVSVMSSPGIWKRN